MLWDEPLLPDLWGDDLRFVTLDEPDHPDPAPARTLEIVLDLVGHVAASSGNHLLDPDDEGILTPEERSMRDLLDPLLRARIDEDAAPAWARVRRLLQEPGADGP